MMWQISVAFMLVLFAALISFALLASYAGRREEIATGMMLQAIVQIGALAFLVLYRYMVAK